MLKNIPKILSPELIKVLCEMGHGDEIVIADANFPACSVSENSVLVRADGLGGCELLDAILSLIPLDQYDTCNFMLMQTVEGDDKPPIWEEYRKIMKKYEDKAEFSFIPRMDYYERAKKAYAVVAGGEEQVYANIILKKGVIK
ncbi:MAG: fucose isomerase [Clostridia bacterium]|nr:fucose isomerase [Clostridia bacterium]